MKRLDNNPALQLEVFSEASDTRPPKSVFSDPSFAINKSMPVHRWVPWIAGFSKEFVSDALDRHLRKSGLVLDPFAGVGTTLVESIIRGHCAVGFEINPYAELACRVKSNAHSFPIDLFRRTVRAYRDFYTSVSSNGYVPKSIAPEGFNTRGKFYSNRVLRKVLATLDFIHFGADKQVIDLLKLAFASTMITYSNYSYEPSLSRRESAGKSQVEDFPVGELIASKLDEMIDDMIWIRSQVVGKPPNSLVFNKSFFDCRDVMDRSSVDLVVTSPPYLNNYHYNRNTRPHLYWLNFVKSPAEMKVLEENNFGKYWQTVRDASRIDIAFPYPPKSLVDCIEGMRRKNTEKGIYGGNGWANYISTYFNDCYRLAVNLKWVLKRRGTALIVIGNNILQGEMIPTDHYLADVAKSVGLEVIDIHVPREFRIGNSIINSKVRVGKTQKSNTLYEAGVELRKK
jgi:DNA modification methylase